VTAAVPALAFIGGVSAVGKTTLLAQLAGRDHAWLCWSASKLIATELGLTALPTDDASEVLRYQDALVRGYARRSREVSLPIVMDGHFTLTAGTTLVAVPLHVFSALAPRALVVLAAPADEIRQRMVARDGAAPPMAALEAWIAAEQDAARATSDALGISLHLWPAEPATARALARLIEELRA
jgi:adenylate kinase